MPLHVNVSRIGAVHFGGPAIRRLDVRRLRLIQGSRHVDQWREMTVPVAELERLDEP